MCNKTALTFSITIIGLLITGLIVSIFLKKDNNKNKDKSMSVLNRNRNTNFARLNSAISNNNLTRGLTYSYPKSYISSSALSDNDMWSYGLYRGGNNNNMNM